MFALTLSTFSVASWAKEKIEGNGEEKRFIDLVSRFITLIILIFLCKTYNKIQIYNHHYIGLILFLIYCILHLIFDNFS